MIRITSTTIVAATPEQVWKGFDETLFKQLSPPFPKISLMRFDGCKQGDVVDLTLDFILLSQRWVSVIKENGQNQEGYYFIDEGAILPFMFTKWKHIHRIEKHPKGTQIIDDVYFQVPWYLPYFLMKIVVWGQFAYRKPIYRQIFGKTSV